MRGIALSCAGFTAWAVCDAMMKFANQTLTSATVMLICVVFGAMTNIILAHCNGGLGQLKTKHIRFHLLRGALCVASFYSCIVALHYLPLTSFYMVVFLSPILIALVEKLFLKESARWPVWLAIVFGFVGILIAAQAMQSDAPDIVANTNYGILLATGCAITYSTVAIMTRYAKNENNYALSLWPDLLILPTAALIMVWEGTPSFTFAGVLWAAVSGVLNGVGFTLTNASLRIAPAAIVSPYHYTQIVTGALLGFCIWGTAPTWGVVIGATMVIASGLYILRHTHQETKLALE
jgi:drug/metabolite transporter (DMT)-like permease